jgi:hypothetical protein
MDPKEKGWKGVNWINFVQDGEDGNKASDSIKVGEFLD